MASTDAKTTWTVADLNALAATVVAAPSTWTLISTTINGGTANFDLQSIPATPYNHLELVAMMRTAAAGTSEFIQCTLNNDAGGNYYRQNVSGRAAAAAAAEGLAANAAQLGEAVGNGAGAGLFTLVKISIPGYASTTWNKNILATVFASEGTGTSTGIMTVSATRWASTAAVNRITIAGTSNGLIVGSALWLYGVT